jgi:hypothetical protein
VGFLSFAALQFQYTSKLLHGLVNTNKQNHLYYGKSSLCPLCQECKESLSHIFTCKHGKAVTSRSQNLTRLTETLLTIRTPQPVIDAIFLEHNPVRALTASLLRSPDAVLTTAFHEQYNTIGWFHFCFGRLSKKWAAAVKQYNTAPKPSDFEEFWTSLLIATLWQYSRALWKTRNEHIHGVTVEEQAQLLLNNLHAKCTDNFEKYGENLAIIFPRHAYLITAKTLESCLSSTYDQLSAWLR